MVSNSDIERALWALRAYDATAVATASPAGPNVVGAFFAPERTGDGIQLLTALLRSSRSLEAMKADPRVAFLCSPGNPSRWVQGAGRAALVVDEAEHAALFERLVVHAPGVQQFLERLELLPVVIAVSRMKIVEALDAQPLLLNFEQR